MLSIVYSLILIRYQSQTTCSKYELMGWRSWGSCGSDCRASHKVGDSIPDSYSLHVKVFLGKILNPKLLPMSVPVVWECVLMCARFDPEEQVGTLHGSLCSPV